MQNSFLHFLSTPPNSSIHSRWAKSTLPAHTSLPRQHTVNKVLSVFWIHACSQQSCTTEISGRDAHSIHQDRLLSAALSCSQAQQRSAVCIAPGPTSQSVMDYFQWFVVLWQHMGSYITTFFSISGAASSPKQSSSSPKGYCALSPQINRDHIIPDCQQRQTSNLQQFQYRSLSSQLAVGAWFPFWNLPE